MDAQTKGHDPRWFQVGSLAALLLASIVLFDLAATPEQSAVTIAAALGAQALFCHARGVRFDPFSPLITGLSLSLLQGCPRRSATRRATSSS